MERCRREKWFCAGVIYWMLNDCWPAASGWSLIDYYNQPKAAYYSFKRAARPILLSIDYADEKYHFYLCNDGKEKELKFRWYIVSDMGDVVYQSLPQKISAAENKTVCLESRKEDILSEKQFLVAEVSDNTHILDRAFYRKGILNICEKQGQIELLYDKDGYVGIKAMTYLHVVELEAENDLFEDNYFSILPGEIRYIGRENKEDQVRVKTYSFGDGKGNIH